MLDSPDTLLKLVNAMRDDHLAKIMAEPNLVTLSNRAASFQAGGVSRVAVPQDNGQMGVEVRPYGTSIDLVPVVSEDQAIHLTCRIEVSELDVANSVIVAGETVPVLRSVRADTATRCRSGQTIVLRGLQQQRSVSSAAAASNTPAAVVTKSDDRPKAKPDVEEIETLVLLTPEIVQPMLADKTAEAKVSR